jgi:hypothetical protein
VTTVPDRNLETTQIEMANAAYSKLTGESFYRGLTDYGDGRVEIKFADGTVKTSYTAGLAHMLRALRDAEDPVEEGQ